MDIESLLRSLSDHEVEYVLITPTDQRRHRVEDLEARRKVRPNPCDGRSTVDTTKTHRQERG